MTKTDLAIIGGGAAGLYAAVQASPYARVTVLEAGARVGKKLLTTGNGRCNLSNRGISPAHYHSNSPRADQKRVVEAILGTYPRESTMQTFENLGFLFREDSEGRIYPRSDQAAAVLDALRLTADARGVQTVCDCTIKSVRRTRDGFVIAMPEGELFARTLLVASGGEASSPHNAYDLVRSLGHTVTPLFPAICPVRTAPEAVRSLKGQRARAEVRLLADGVCAASTVGEVQFTENGLSGICVFELSRYVGEFRTFGTVNGKPCRSVELGLNFLPELSEKETFALVARLASLELPEELNLSGVLPKRVAAWIAKDAPNHKVLVSRLRDARFKPAGLVPWNQAQVTAGGVSLSEINGDASSRKVPGLFFAGEVMDVDGDCGGYNLQWAWSSAQSAVDRALRYLERI